VKRAYIGLRGDQGVNFRFARATKALRDKVAIHNLEVTAELGLRKPTCFARC
jgi:hypothetical protein